MADTKHKRDIRHPAFPQLDDDVPLWRYTDFANFVWTLSQRALWLARCDLLGDEFEGSIPKRDHDEFIAGLIEANVDGFDSEAEARKHVLDVLVPRNAILRKSFMWSTQVNCWSAAVESEAMWRLYCGRSYGVAMVSTFGKLKASLTDPATRLGKVRYIDYNRAALSGNDLLQPMTHKRIAFVHENEVRIVRWLSKEMEGRSFPPGPNDPPLEPGRKMDWNPEQTVDRIVVSPYAQEWYLAAVRDTLSRFAPSLQKYVRWSELRGDPLF